MWQKLTAALIKLRILRWRRTYPRSSRWGQYNTKGLHKREAGESKSKKERGCWKQTRVMPLLALKMEEGAMNQGMQVTSRKQKRKEKKILP